jgi:hypothetical protein
MKHDSREHVGMILAGKTEKLGENPVPVPLLLPQIPHIELGANSGCRGERTATNRLSHGTANFTLTESLIPFFRVRHVILGQHQPWCK